MYNNYYNTSNNRQATYPFFRHSISVEYGERLPVHVLHESGSFLSQAVDVVGRQYGGYLEEFVREDHGAHVLRVETEIANNLTQYCSNHTQTCVYFTLLQVSITQGFIKLSS